MQLISKEDIEKAREMDLLSYLTYYEPDNLRHVSGNVYSTNEHDSLITSRFKNKILPFFRGEIDTRVSQFLKIKIWHLNIPDNIQHLHFIGLFP